jgi:hypothetical protein
MAKINLLSYAFRVWHRFAMDRMAYTLKEKICPNITTKQKWGEITAINGHNILQANIEDYANSLRRL